jgi:hypothetical protein
MTDALAIIFIFGGGFSFLTAIILGPSILKAREKQRLHETLRLAYEKGQPVPPEMIEALQMDKPRLTPQRDLRRGIILICVAAAMVVLAYMLGQIQEAGNYAFGPLVGCAAFPAFVGLGYIGFWLAGRRKTA